MKKIKIFIAITIITIGLFSLSSCFTKKRGVVPCPHGYNIDNTNHTDAVPMEKVIS